MKVEELLISFAYAYKAANKNTDVAIWFDPQKGDFLVGVKGTQAHETPIITAIMPNPDRWEDKDKRFMIFTTYVPTETCMGMAWRADVGKIVFIDGGVVHHYATTTPGPSGFKKTKGLPALTSEVDAPDPKSFTLDVKNGTFGGAPKDATSFHEAVLKSGDALVKKLVTAAKKPFSTRASFPHLRALVRDTTGKDILPKAKAGGGDNKEVADHIYSSLVYALVSRAWLEKAPKVGFGSRAYGNNIGCVLTNKDNSIIAWGLNYKGLNPNYHAETWMIQEYLYLTGANKLPEGVTMYTSLESCYMCAGFFADVAPKGRCIYLQEDPQVPNSALKRKVNGVTQIEASQIKFPPDLSKELPGLTKLKDEKEDTITFLFGPNAKKKYKLEGKKHEEYVEWLANFGIDKADVTEEFIFWAGRHSLLFLQQLIKMNDKSPVMKQIAGIL